MFLSVENLFYNIAAIIVALFILGFGVLQIKKLKNIKSGIILIVHAVLFIGFGILGFFIPKGYDYITILAMLAFTITLIICILVFMKKPETDYSRIKKKEK